MSRLTCPKGHGEKYFRTDSYYEIVWCSRCGDETSYEFSDLQEIQPIQPDQVPFRYQVFNPFSNAFNFFLGSKKHGRI